MKKPTICRYCGGIIRLVPAADVYGSSTERLGMQNEYLYQCQNCNARVGCHKGTTRPLGDVANEILRLKRIEVHYAQTAITFSSTEAETPVSSAAWWCSLEKPTARRRKSRAY